MTGSIASWIWIAIIGVCIGVYYLRKRDKIGGGGISIKLPKMSGPKAETQIERLKAAAEKEVARAEELRSVLEAKRELVKARAENVRLAKEIEGVSPRSLEREKRDGQKVKPKRL